MHKGHSFVKTCVLRMKGNKQHTRGLEKSAVMPPLSPEGFSRPSLSRSEMTALIAPTSPFCMTKYPRTPAVLLSSNRRRRLVPGLAATTSHSATVTGLPPAARDMRRRISGSKAFISSSVLPGKKRGYTTCRAVELPDGTSCSGERQTGASDVPLQVGVPGMEAKGDAHVGVGRRAAGSPLGRVMLPGKAAAPAGGGAVRCAPAGATAIGLPLASLKGCPLASKTIVPLTYNQGRS